MYHLQFESGKIAQTLVALQRNDDSSEESLLHHIMTSWKAVKIRNSYNKGSFREEDPMQHQEELQFGHNPFSEGQIVRMLEDEPTFKAMQTNLGNKMTHLVSNPFIQNKMNESMDG